MPKTITQKIKFKVDPETLYATRNMWKRYFADLKRGAAALKKGS